MTIRTSIELKAAFGAGEYPRSVDYADLVDTIFGQVPSSTDVIAEGSANLYFTDARAQLAVAQDIQDAIDSLTIDSTDVIPEGTSNLYFTEQRVIDTVEANVALTSLANVSTSSLSSGDVLIYNGSVWTNQGAAQLDVELSSVSDVTITNVAPGQTLVYNGNEWVNQAPSGGGFETNFLLMGA